MFYFDSFTCSCPVFPALPIEEASSPMYILASFVKDELIIESLFMAMAHGLWRPWDFEWHPYGTSLGMEIRGLYTRILVMAYHDLQSLTVKVHKLIRAHVNCVTICRRKKKHNRVCSREISSPLRQLCSFVFVFCFYERFPGLNLSLNLPGLCCCC